MNPSHRRSQFHWLHRVLLVSLLLSTLLLAWSTGPVLTTFAAQQTPTEPQSQIVERWRGTVYEENTSTHSYDMCPWVCPGDAHRLDRYDWDLEVDDGGYVRGYIKTELLDHSYAQSETNLLCGPVAETDYVLLGCRYAVKIGRPRGEYFVEGTRSLDPYTHQPVLKLDHSISIAESTSLWQAVGTHSETGAAVHKQDDTTWGLPFVPQTYRIQTYEDGQLPRIPMDYSFSWLGGSTVRWGNLVGTPQKPFLEVDRELLERSIFLDQVPIEETFTANTEWNSPDGGWVTWQLSDSAPEQIGPTKEAKVPKPLNVGGQGVGRKPLTAQAKTTLNLASSPKATQVTVAPPPSWAGGPSQIIGVKGAGSVVYKGSRMFPEPAFEGRVNVPSIVPFLGGKTLGIVETQGGLAWEAQSTSEGQGSLKGQTGFEAMGGKVVGSLAGRAHVVLTESGVDIPDGGIDFGISGKLSSKEEPLLSVIPALRPVLTAIEAISTRAAQFITDRAKAKLELEPKLDFGFNFLTQNGEIKFKSAEATPGFGFKTIVELNLIEKWLKASASIGGAISATFKVPAPYFKQAVLEGIAQAQITLWRYVGEGQKAWQVVISGAGAASGAAAAGAGGEQALEANGGSGGWRLLDRSYLEQPNYARWHGDAPQARAQGAQAPTGEDTLLVENVFPLANPSLDIKTDAYGNVRMVQVWAHDKPGSPPQSGGEIAYSRNYGTMWYDPAYLTSDDRDDLAPKAVHLPNGNDVLVLWQRMDTSTPPAFPDDPAGYVSHWQIAARALSDVASVPVKQLSASGSLNYRHQLGATADGALAVWVNNPTNKLFGDATNPDQILFARYLTAGKIWSAAAPVITNLAGLMSLDLATNGQYGALVYSQDMDGDLATDADRELFYVTWAGSAWSAPTRLTNNSVVDDNPQVVLDGSGAPSLVWRQNGGLVFLHGSWSGTADVLALAGAGERPDFEMVRDSDGRLALIWQRAQADVTTIGYAVYDASHSRWSGERTVPPTEDSGIVAPATSMATAITAGLIPPDPDNYYGEVNGHLVLGYQLAHVENVTRTVEGITVPNVPQIGQQDLRAASVPLVVNLSVSPADLSLPSADVLQAVIHNTGDLAVAGLPVALHMGYGDPVTGATDTVTQTVPLIAAGSAVTLTYSLAGRSESVFAVQIDPQRTLRESTVADNSAVLGVDLAIAPLPAFYSPGGTMVRALITQNSARFVSLIVTSTLSLDAPDGPVIGWNQIAFPLTATTGITVSTFVTPTQVGPGRHQIFWTVDPGDTLGEADRDNNVAGTTVMVFPDLDGADDLVYFGRAPAATAPFTMTVSNLGNWPNSGGSIQVFDGLPGKLGVHSLLKSDLPAIQPGGQAEVAGLLQLAGLPAAASGLSGIYVQIDPDGSVDESSENNNLVAAGAVLVEGDSGYHYQTYLPLLIR